MPYPAQGRGTQAGVPGKNGLISAFFENDSRRGWIMLLFVVRWGAASSRNEPFGNEQADRANGD